MRMEAAKDENSCPPQRDDDLRGPESQDSMAMDSRLKRTRVSRDSVVSTEDHQKGAKRGCEG